MTPFLQEQLNFLVNLSHHRTPFWDKFFLVADYLDSVYCIFLLASILWLAISWRWGIRFFYLMLISASINYFLKIVFGEPRPYTLIPELALHAVGQNSFPSGAAQNTLIYAGLLIYVFQRRWAYVLGVIYPLFVGFSRLYLGVHYPTDILGGYLFGFIILMAFIKLHKPLESVVTKRPYWSFVLSLFLFASIIYLYPSPKVFLFMGTLITITIGIFFSLMYGLYLQNTSYPSDIFLRSLLGGGTVVIIYLLLGFSLSPYYPSKVLLSIQGSIIGLWISLFASPFLKVLIPHTKWMNEHYPLRR